MRFGIGQPVTRSEDPRFVTGRGRYVADIDLPHQTYAAFIYSPHAHADIVAIDTAAAAALPGVVAVLTGQDWIADGLGTIDPEMMPEDMGGPKGYRTKRYPLAVGRVRYVGERVAAVIAATEAQARDAADLVAIEYRTLPAVVRATDAVAADAPPIYEGAARNTSFTLRMGNADAVAPAFARAHHVTKLTLFNNRLNAMTMEPRGCIGDYDEGTGRYTLYTSTQNVHGIRHGLSHQILHIPEGRIRVVARDVGGGFGMKGQVYPEEAVVTWAARQVSRPVKWIASRAEALMGDNHGRDQLVTAELALAADGRFLALRWSALHNVGAYIEGAGAVPIVFSLRLAPTVYDIPAVDVSSSAVFTNTAPTVPYRGAGRPEAVYIMERLIDQAAHEMDIDRAEIRRKNFISPAAMPYTTRTGWTYDTGEYAAALEKCMTLADWQGFAARRRVTEAAGRRRGRAIVYYVDNTGIFNDRMEIRFDPSGTLTILSGMLSHGQGHETTFAQMVSEWLGVPPETIRLAQADTDEVAIGRGTYASRSMMVGGSALRVAADEVIERGKRFAGHFMEANAGDIVFADGKFTVAGTDKAMPIGQIAQMSFIPVGLPNELGVGLQGAGSFSADVPSFPNGCHICEVEVDPETGATVLDRYAVVDDVGTVINPLLARGQVHGGVAQGAGQALCEDIHYDRESGQLVTGTLMDYAVPRADTVPDVAVDFSPVPSKSNPLGVKGVGEGGTVAATPTVMNAIIDALAPLGVTDVEMPATAERVWRAIRKAGG
ncbi:MAG TPA: xanthine dehydrogenase family protein molybdopterin-binding subunit [Xanthobacteraceae bacterium]|nr:xanthine dehydrogenase family protein molybdopterin-binding subunit [Xanthobacteraceae bacterium]